MAKHGAKKPTTRAKSRYVPALDGLRAFAVLAVIAYHMSLGWAPGGLMGVTVFFVISGYLINGLLVAERERTGRISLKSFWLRRVRRLFPAIALAVAGTAALCTVFNPGLLDKMRPDILPSLLFYNNWWQIFRDLSYFEAAGAPSPLVHFWSLSIEEQFYLIWPPLLVLMYAIGMKKRTIARAPERHSNVTVADWYAASEGHEEYFAGDGTHLTDEGAHAYVALIQEAIEGVYDSTADERAKRQEAIEIATALQQGMAGNTASSSSSSEQGEGA